MNQWGKFGNGAAMVPALVGLALATFAGQAQEGAAQFVSRLDDPDTTVRLAVLTWMQQRWQQLQSDFAQTGADDRKLIRGELELLRASAGKVALLARQDPDQQVRIQAIQTLAVLRPDIADPAVRATWELLLQRGSPTVARAAAQSLSTWVELSLREINNPHAELGTLELVERMTADLLQLAPIWEIGLQHSEIAVRQPTLHALHLAATILTQRIIGQQDSFRDEKSGGFAVKALENLAALLRRLQPHLQDNLALPHRVLRQPICEMLESLGELTSVLHHPDLQPVGEKIARQFERTLDQLVPAVLNVLNGDLDAEVRLAAASALETAAKLSSETVGPLLTALHDSDPWVRWTVARCLEAEKAQRLQQHQMQAVVRSLAARLLEEGELGVRQRLAQSLESWKAHLDSARQEVAWALSLATTPWPGAEPGPFSPAHIGVAQPMRDPEVLVTLLAAMRGFAEEQRKRNAPLPQEWLAGLVAALRAEKATVRIESCRVLAHYGPQAYAVRRSLVPLLQDDNPQVRSAAAAALLRITPPQ